MYKVSVVGIDNTGKSSVVNYVKDMDNVNTFHLTSANNNGSYFAHTIRKPLKKLVNLGEHHNLRGFTGAAYLLHLIPYAIETKTKTAPILVSDRDPLIDTLTHAQIYLPRRWGYSVQTPLRKSLEYLFGLPNEIIYLNVSPEVSVQRNGQIVQIHEKVKSLHKLQDAIEIELDRLSHLDINIHSIDTETNCMDEVKHQVFSTLTTIVKKNTKQI